MVVATDYKELWATPPPGCVSIGPKDDTRPNGPKIGVATPQQILVVNLARRLSFTQDESEGGLGSVGNLVSLAF